jgi:hypothetical protein
MIRSTRTGGASGRAFPCAGCRGYFLSAEGFLMPAKKDQAPPDLRYFKPTNP